jgi:DNA-binding response OmpR family regulator
VLRRSQATAGEADVLRAGPLRLDQAGRRVSVDGAEVALTRKEFDLLAALMRAPGRVLTRERLLQQVWGYDAAAETRTVDVHVRQLRRKLGAPAAAWVETVVGVGYRLRGAE